MFLSEPMDVSKFGLIYGGVQKNIGPAGVTIVIVRDDLVREDVLPFTPTIMRYTTQAEGEVAVEHPAGLRHLHLRPCVQVAEGAWAACPLWPSATRRRPPSSTITSIRASCSAAPPARRIARS